MPAVRSCPLLLLAVALWGAPARAQTAVGPLRVSGSVTVSAEGYGASGIEARRPGGLGTVTAQTQFSLFGLSSGVGLSYSTDQTGVRQRINRGAFRTQWAWGAAAAGDVAPVLPRYALAGRTALGGLVEARRGPVALAVAGGRSRRAVEGAPETTAFRGAAYRQWLWGGSVGVGQPARTFARLGGVWIRDEAASVPADTLLPGLGGVPLRPQASVTLVPEAGASLWADRLRLRALAAVSTFDRDLRAGGAERTRDAAWEGSAALRLPDPLGAESPLDAVDLTAELVRVGPGYQALGAPRLRADEQTVRLQPRVQLFGRRLDVSADVARTTTDALAQAVAQATRTQLGAAVLVRPTDWLQVSARALQLDDVRDPTGAVPDSLAGGPAADPFVQTARTLAVVPLATLRRADGTTHTASLSTTLQRTASERAGVDGFETSNAAAALSYALALPSGLSASLAASGFRSTATVGESRSLSLQGGGGHTVLGGRLTLGLSGGWTRTAVEAVAPAVAGAPGAVLRTVTQQLSATGTAAVRLPGGNPVRLQLVGLRSTADGAGRSFSEGRARLTYSHRF